MLFSAATPVAVIAAVLFLIGLSRSIQFGSFNALTYGDIPPGRMSAASSLASTFQQLAFGVGIAFGALALHLASWFGGGHGQGYGLGDFRVAFAASAALALVSALAFTRLAPNAGAETSGHRHEDAAAPALAG